MIVIEHKLGKMVQRLEDMKAKQKTATKRASSSAGRAAKATAAKSIIDRAELRKAPGAAGRLRSKMVFVPDHVNLGGTLRSRSKGESLVHWASPNKPKASYVGRGVTVNQGDIISGRKHFSPTSAFVRNLNGKKHMLWREGNRTIGGIFRSVPPSRLLVDDTTSEVTISRYFDVYQNTYRRNMGL